MSTPTLSPAAILENQRWLYNFVRQLVTDDFAAEDIVQETLERAITNKESKGEHRGWLKGVAYNLVLEFRRKNARRRRREESYFAANVSIAPDPKEILSLANQVLIAVECLPKIQQQVILMRHMLGKKPAEIGATLELSREEVYRHLERGCKRVQEDLKQRYGVDYRAGCAAILGLKLPGIASTILKSVAIAAAALLLLGAAWLGIDRLTDPAETLAESSAGMTSAWDGMVAPASSTSINDATSPPAVFREAVANSANQFHGSFVQILKPDGSPLAFSQVMADWNSASHKKLHFETDANGFAKIELPPEVISFALSTKAFNCFNPRVVLLAGYPAAKVTHRLVTGNVRQTLRAVDWHGNPLEGARIKVYGKNSSAGVGYFLSGPDGLVDALLPGTGVYAISMDMGYAFEAQQFFVDAESMQRTLDIPCVVRPTDFTLRALQYGAPTPTAVLAATFTDYQLRWDEFGTVQAGKMISLMDATNGTLHYRDNAEGADFFAIMVRAPGYQSVQVFLHTNTESEAGFPVFLHSLQFQPTRIKFLEAGRSLVRAELIRAVRRVQWPPELSGPNLNDSTQESVTLEIQPDGTFLLPFAPTEEYHPASLVVVDDLGRENQIPLPRIQDLEKDVYGVAQIDLGPNPAAPLTLQLLDESSNPLAGKRVDFLFTERVANNLHVLHTDRHGIVRTFACFGENVSVNFYPDDYLVIQGEWQLPSSGDRINATFQLPPLDASIKLRFQDADGFPTEFGSCSSVAQSPLPILVNGVPSGSMELIIRHSAKNIGSLVTQKVPSGVYETTAKLKDNKTKAIATHHSNVEQVLQFPRVEQLLFLITDADGRPIPMPTIGRVVLSSKAGFQRDSFAQGDPNGHAILNQTTLPSGDSVLLVAAAGFEPLIVTNPLIGQMNYGTLEKAREFEPIDMAALGFTVTEDHFWIIDAWGDSSDPRQTLVWEDLNRQRLCMDGSGVPATAFKFIEVDSSGNPTGAEIPWPAAN